MTRGGYARYVALGDSQTEGLWDGDDTRGVQGFADRLALRIDGLWPGLHYANLAVRGRRIRDVVDHQLAAAQAMQPDLITSCIGMNDVTRPGRSFDRALDELNVLHAELAATGATVVVTTFPNIAQILPAGRLLSSRVQQINAVIRADAARHDLCLVDLYSASSMTDPQTWSPDRVHGSPRGHHLFAEAAAEALRLPGSNHDWAVSRPDVVLPGFRSRMYSQALWGQNMLMPWIWRHLRGRSAANGRGPRRPMLEPVSEARVLSEAE
ncbi:MAG: SGNH/GDSL hydrolase family protein [Mycobacterium sp.]